MGVLVPVPPGKMIMSMRVGESVVDLTVHQHDRDWRCLYCHAVQPATRCDCRNCGAPSPNAQEAIDWIAARAWKAQGHP